MAKSKNTKKKALNRGFSITLGIKGCFWAGFVFFLGIVWAFILGVIVGRGYGPIDIMAPFKRGIKSSSINKKSTSPQSVFKSQKKVLSPTELTFLNKVRQNDVDVKKAKQKKANFKKSYPQPRKKSYRYQWLIQISSFKNKKDAIALVNKLRKKSFSAKVEDITINNHSYFRVLVVLEGSNKYIQDKMKLLSKMGFKDYIVKMRRKL